MNGTIGKTTSAARGASIAATIEWPTLALLGACYAAWAIAAMLYTLAPWLAVSLLALTIVLHSSLQHEAIHRHPTSNASWNEALVWLPLGLLVPYRRFREQHLLHHVDNRLTDPYDDPESYYLSRSDWQSLPRPLRKVLQLNNVLAVRMLFGPAIAAATFLWAEAKALMRPADGEGRRKVRLAWAHHVLGLVALAAIVHFFFAMPFGAYALAAYLARSLLAVRSYCEHQWAERVEARTVIVESPLLGFLFLNNNLHVVHHAHPRLPWHALPAAYRARHDEWQAINGGYVFGSYGAVLRNFAFRAKERVPHPVRTGR
jgi:fatty acid desaturase